MATIQKTVLSKRGVFEGTAIQSAYTSLSYNEFDSLTDDFAYALSQKNVGPEKNVVLHMKRSVEMVVAMFGILKSGAGLVPIVSDFPEKRLESVIDSSGAIMVVTDLLYKELMSDALGMGRGFLPEMAGESDPAIVLIYLRLYRDTKRGFTGPEVS